VLKDHVRARSGGVCERCRRRPHTQTHHLTYERVGHEDLEDLQGLCDLCHEYLSAKIHLDPADFFSITLRDWGRDCSACGASGPALAGWIGRHRFLMCLDCLGTLLASIRELGSALERPIW
jgi:hypothetical protein